MRRFVRLFHITIVCLKYDLDNIIWSLPLFRPISFLKIFFPWRWGRQHKLPHGEAIRKALEELGPIFVKFGQLLSVRRDLLPDDIALALAALQDKVSAFDGDIAVTILEHSFGKSIYDIFSKFNKIPIAAASIAQVHAATLKNGQKVAVKILRPHIKQHIHRDLKLLHMIASLANRYWPSAKRYRPLEVFQELKNTLYDELDLLREAANASQLRRNFRHTNILQVPKVYWDHTKRNILVMQRIHGVSITDLETLRASHVDLKLLAKRGVEIFFTQVFRDCFFHADMHPGNIFVDISTPSDPKYISVDFGIMGSLSSNEQLYIAKSFLAFFNRDYRQVALLHIKSGWVPPNIKLESLEFAIRTVCEPIFERPFNEISFAQTLLRLFQVAQRFDMKVQPQLLLLQKTLLSIEGLGLQLYPELNLWDTAKPFLDNWIRARIGPKAIINNVKHYFPDWLDNISQLPEAFLNIAKHLQTEKQAFNSQTSPSKNRFRQNILGIGLVISGISLFIYTAPKQWFSHYGVWLSSGIVLLGIGILLYKKLNSHHFSIS